jgi:hypothetical protein
MLKKVSKEMKWPLTKNSNNSKKIKQKNLPKSETCIMNRTTNLKLKKKKKREKSPNKSTEKIIMMILKNV